MSNNSTTFPISTWILTSFFTTFSALHSIEFLALPQSEAATRGVRKRWCSQKLRKIHMKKHVPETLFNNVGGLRPATLLKKSLWHRYFPLNFTKFLRTTFLQNSSGRLLLHSHTNSPVHCIRKYDEQIFLIDIVYS